MIYLKEEIIQAVKKSIKISDRALQAYVNKSKYSADNFGILLIRDNIIARSHIGKIIGDCYNISYIELSSTIYFCNVYQLIPIEFFLNLKSIPLYVFEDTITVATADPFSNILKMKLSKLLSHNVNLLFSFSDEVSFYLYKKNNELLLNDKAKCILTKSSSATQNENDKLLYQLSNYLIRRD